MPRFFVGHSILRSRLLDRERGVLLGPFDAHLLSMVWCRWMMLLMSSQSRWLRGSVMPDDGSLALLVGSDACLMILCGAVVLTDRWFRPVVRSLALLARFTSTAEILPRSLVSFAGSLVLPRALMGSFRVDDGEP
jgi:hypothetical protein